MKLLPKRYWPKLQARYHAGNTVWASRGYKIVISRDAGQTWSLVTMIPSNPIWRLLFRFEPVSRLLRLGVRCYTQIDPESFVAFANSEVFYWRAGMTCPLRTGKVRHGFGPLLQGCCNDDAGNCYYGEYWSNAERREVYVWRWRREWDSWRVFYRFPEGAVRHVHAVQFDPFSERVWVTTGDRDHESLIGYFEGTLENPELTVVSSGDQSARAVSLLFTREFVYWGSDAGRDTRETSNHIYRWSRASREIERVATVGAPAYYSTVDDQERLYVSTGVEGSPSERDRYARVWASADGVAWIEAVRWLKDSYPRIFGHGRLAFPQGRPSGDQLYVVGWAVQGAVGTWLFEVSEA